MCVMSTFVCIHVCYSWDLRLSELSDLHSFLTIKTFWPSCECSEPTLIMLTLPPWHNQSDNHHPIKFFLMHKPHTMLTTYTITSYVKSIIGWQLTQIKHVHTNSVEVNVGTAHLNESMDDWHSNTLFQVCYWKLP